MSGGLLDAAALARLERELGGSKGRVRAILAVYREEIGPYCSEIREAVARADAHDVVFGAHRLGSASVLVGATRLTALCRELESLNHDALGQRGLDLVELISAATDDVVDAVRALLDGDAGDR